eukprot:tig00020537_g10258.t1
MSRKSSKNPQAVQQQPTLLSFFSKSPTAASSSASQQPASAAASQPAPNVLSAPRPASAASSASALAVAQRDIAERNRQAKRAASQKPGPAQTFTSPNAGRAAAAGDLEEPATPAPRAGSSLSSAPASESRTRTAERQPTPPSRESKRQKRDAGGARDFLSPHAAAAPAREVIDLDPDEAGGAELESPAPRAGPPAGSPAAARARAVPRASDASSAPSPRAPSPCERPPSALKEEEMEGAAAGEGARGGFRCAQESAALFVRARRRVGGWMREAGLADDDAGGPSDAPNKFAWLKEASRDEKGRCYGDPGYVPPPRIHVPAEAMKAMPQFAQQYWAIKSECFDCVLFTRLGKFYELYMHDADVGHRELGLNYTRNSTGGGRMRCVGVMEGCEEEAITKLVALGYRVGKVEERERAADAKARCPRGAIVRRELSRVYTSGTLTDALGVDAAHLLALVELPHPAPRCAALGVCFLDPATAQWALGPLDDDPHRTGLDGLVTGLNPAEIVCAGPLSPPSRAALRRGGRAVPLHELPAAEGEPAAAADALRRLFGPDEAAWPAALRGLPPAAAGPSPPASRTCAAAASRRSWRRRAASSSTALRTGPGPGRAGAGDGGGDAGAGRPALRALEVVSNPDAGPEGTLLELLDRTGTPFGRRLLRRALLAPLRRVEEIEDRLDALEDLNERLEPEARGALEAALRRLPDLERLLARLAPGAAVSGRAERRRVADLVALLDGSRAAQAALRAAAAAAPRLRSRRLRALLAAAAADCGAAEGRGGPVRAAGGAGGEHGEAAAAAREAEAALEAYLGEQRARLKLPAAALRYAHVAGARYLLALDAAAAKRAGGPPPEYEHGRREAAAGAHLGLVTAAVAGRVAGFAGLARSVAEVDLLLALSHTARPPSPPRRCSWGRGGGRGGAVLRARGLRHPTLRVRVVVPNDLQLGGGAPRALVVTGPNMGGKSTLARAAAVACLLAHLGCYVPAEALELSPADRLFARLGAGDRLLAGQSTFAVELEETATILRHATPRSLAIIDELGRGTSTHDGYAVALAALRHLAAEVRCRLLFATHYHALAASPTSPAGAGAGPLAGHGHMAGPSTPAASCPSTPSARAFPHSFGVACARAAALPDPSATSAPRFRPAAGPG